MGKPLAGWFIYILVVTILAAYIGSCLSATGDRHAAIHGVGIVAFIGYAVALWQMSVWYHRKVSTTVKATVDGFIYAVLTFFIFAAVWPK